jgi:putative effector of murein hydrolase LrgA (UPF0299 family)
MLLAVYFTGATLYEELRLSLTGNVLGLMLFVPALQRGVVNLASNEVASEFLLRHLLPFPRTENMFRNCYQRV